MKFLVCDVSPTLEYLLKENFVNMIIKLNPEVYCLPGGKVVTVGIILPPATIPGTGPATFRNLSILEVRYVLIIKYEEHFIIH